MDIKMIYGLVTLIIVVVVLVAILQYVQKKVMPAV